MTISKVLPAIPDTDGASERRDHHPAPTSLPNTDASSMTPGAARPAVGGEVRLSCLARDYGALRAVSDINLVIAPGEFLTLLGASGSGKTTTLMMIAGFVSPSRGDVHINGRSIVDMPPDKRNLGVVFQSYALFPHMTVTENVGFPLRMRKLSKHLVQEKVAEALGLVHLAGYGNRKIHELSGGQQQRVALARALVFRPPVLLMDEPLGALDRKLREHMQAEIKRIQRDLGITVIYVTHDQEEALVLSDRIAIMERGRMHQIGTPEEVYERPATPYVASFLGDSNFLDGIFDRHESDVGWVRLATGEEIAAGPGQFRAGDKVRVMVRPESMQLKRPGISDIINTVKATIEETEYLGQSIRYTVRSGEARLSLRETRREEARRHRRGDVVALHWGCRATILYPRTRGESDVMTSGDED